MADEEAPLWQAIVTIVLVVLMFIVLAMERFPSDFVMLFFSILFLPLGILTPKEVTAGFGNDSMLTVMALLIVTQSLVATGGLELMKRIFYSLAKSDNPNAYHIIVASTLYFVGFIGFFIANTPLVAMFIPFMQDLAARFRVAPSKLLLPLSYVAILSGTCSLIGTTTNLVAVGLAKEAIPGFEMGLLDIARIGIPVLFAGIMYVLICGPLLLPDRGGVSETVRNPREYLVTFVVAPASAVAGRTIERAGLRQMPGLFLTYITRDDELIAAPGPETVLLAGDRLTFAGNIEAVVTLTRLRGLNLVEDEDHDDLVKLPGDKTLVEAVVAPHSEIANKSVREVAFRSRFNAAIIAVHRNGERIDHQRIGDIVLRGGDTLLLITRVGFLETNRTSSTFALVRPVEEYVRVRHKLAPVSLLAMLALIVVSSAADVALFTCAAFACAFVMITRCITPKEARDAVKLDLMIMIACGFALSTALVNSGAARLVAEGLIKAAEPTGFAGLLIVVYVITTIFNAAVTNNAAVAIMFPITYEVAVGSGYDFLPLLYALMFAGSADFSTPYGYNTNLMVYGPGGYRFIDYVKFGMPLQIICAVVSLSVIVTIDQWWVWALVLLLVNVAFVAGAVLWTRHKRRHHAQTVELPEVREAKPPEFVDPALETGTAANASNSASYTDSNGSDRASVASGGENSRTGIAAESATGGSAAWWERPTRWVVATGQRLRAVVLPPSPEPRTAATELTAIGGSTATILALPNSTSSAQLL